MRKQTVGIALVSILCAALCTGTATAQSSRYVVTRATIFDLGTLGGAQSTALDINDSSDIVGWAHDAAGRRHAFLYRAGMMENISGSPGAIWESEANGINNYREVVGTYRVPWLPERPKGFYWYGGVTRLLNDFYSLECNEPKGSEAFAINDWGDMVGRIWCNLPDTAGRYEAAKWTSVTRYTLLDHTTGSWRAPPFVWDNVAYDINESGTAVGRTSDFEQMTRWRNAPAPNRDVVWTASGFFDPGLPEDGARAINYLGGVAGKMMHTSNGTWRAFYWSGPGSRAVNLGLLPNGLNSYGHDLNNERFVVGAADTRVSVPPFVLQRKLGFIHHPDFGMYALPVLPTTYHRNCEANAVNDRHAQSGRVHVVGYCRTSDGVRAVLWDVTVLRVTLISPGAAP